MSDSHIQNIRRTDGRTLLVLRELLRCRNASQVAVRLNMSQSAVSHSLARLRQLFADPLFLRRAHGLEPTARALALAPRVERVIALMGELTGDAVGFDPAVSERRFKLIVPEFVGALAGARLAEIFAAHAPDACFALHHVSGETVWNLLRRGEVDIAVGRFDAPPSTDFAVAPLYEDRYCVAVRRDHPRIAQHAEEIALEDYETGRHVFAHSNTELASWEPHWDSGELRAPALVPHWLTALSVVSTSDAIATCPRRLAERMADRFGLKVLEPPFDTEPIRVYGARRRNYEDEGIDWLQERLREALAPVPLSGASRSVGHRP